jgi:hypothetical protein
MAEQVAAETELVAAAAAGDHEAFRLLVEPIRRELHLLSYRMVGSFHDAEDVLQDAQLKAWRSLSAYYVQAWEAGDIDAIVSMLTADAVHAMPPWAAWFAGREALRVLYTGYDIWKERPRPGVFRILPTALNGQLAFAEYCRERPDRPYTPLAFTVVTLSTDGTRVAEKVSFVQPDLLVRAGFPPVLD